MPKWFTREDKMRLDERLRRNEMDELKPCPFCGKKPVVKDTFIDCDCTANHWYFRREDKEKTIELWNTRSDTELQDDFKTIAIMSEAWQMKYHDLLRRVKEAVSEVEDELIGDEGNVAKQIVYKYIPELEDTDE